MKTINCNGQLISLENPLVMGILNITEDSFFDGGKYFNNEKKALQRVEQMLSEGADIIDIGCMSTRPNSIEITEEEELKRVAKIIPTVKKHFPKTILSIDTWRSNVAKQAIELGASIINDISGGQFDENMFKIAADFKTPYILTHTPAKPNVMQQQTAYKDVVKDIFDYFSQKLEELHRLNVSDIILDFGFGFGKTIEQNYELLRNISIFKQLNHPILIALSRKTMLYKPLNIKPQEALNATTVAHTYALLQGINMLRTHDVKEAKEAITIIHKLK